MRRFLDMLTSRRTSIALMAFIAVCGALGAWIPQSSSSTAEIVASWEARNPAVAGIADALGLREIFSSWWFVTVLAVFAAALTVATLRMFSSAAQRRDAVARKPRTEISGAAIERVAERARATGFREQRRAGSTRVFVRHGMGLWAPAILHVGLLVALVSGGIALALTRSAIADFSQGEIRMPGDDYYAVEDPADAPEVGVPLRFDGMKVENWPQGGLKEVVATLSVLDGTEDWTPRTVSINHPLRLRGHTIYAQPGEFGDAAFLVFTAEDGTEYPVRMEFVYAEAGEVVYTAEPLTIGGVALEGRWDPHGVRGPVPLALRLAGDDAVEPVTLAEGETATVAGLEVEYSFTGQWARFIIQKEPGILALLLGFAVIGAGSIMLYAWIPRVLVVEETAEGVCYSWYAARMPGSYLPELAEMLGANLRQGEDA